MKLAEALVLRADLQKRVVQVRDRLRQSALVQEGEQPPENPQELLAELDRVLNQLGEMIARLNRTNMQTILIAGKTLTDALAERDVLALRHGVLNMLADTASVRIDRLGRSEIRKVATVDVSELRKQADDVARRRRELDTAIQALNWATDLIE